MERKREGQRQDQEVTMMDQESWRKFMHDFSLACGQNVAALGVCVRHALLHAPSDWGGAAREQKKIATGVLRNLALDQEQAKKLHNDLLPLPLNLSEEDVAWDRRARYPLEMVLEDGAEARAASSKAWLQAAVMVMNTLYTCPQSLNKLDRSKAFRNMPTQTTQANEKEAWRTLEGKVERFLERCREDGTQVRKDWAEYLKGKVANYDGGVVAKARELTWEQVEKGLPPIGLSARVDAHKLARGRIQELLANPELVVKPPELWPKKARTSRIMASQAEVKKICQGLFERKIVRVAKPEEMIFDQEGNVIAAGLFGIGKGQEFLNEQGSLVEILRLIINMVGVNEVFEDFDGDTATLPYLGQWRALCLEKGEIFAWAGEDLKSAFYLLLLPEVWGKYMLIDLLLPGSWFGETKAEVMLCLNVIPMGWKLAVAVAQHVMRQLVRQSNMVPKELELRRDKPPPCQQDFSTKAFWQAYIDDLGKGRRLKKKEKDGTEGWLLAVKASGQVLGFVFDEGEKRQAESSKGDSLGARIAGTVPEVFPKPLRCAEGLSIAAHVMSDAIPRLKYCNFGSSHFGSRWN